MGSEQDRAVGRDYPPQSPQKTTYGLIVFRHPPLLAGQYIQEYAEVLVSHCSYAHDPFLVNVALCRYVLSSGYRDLERYHNAPYYLRKDLGLVDGGRDPLGSEFISVMKEVQHLQY